MLYFFLSYYILTLAFFGIPLYSYWDQIKEQGNYKACTDNPIVTFFAVVLFCWAFPLFYLGGKSDSDN
jgi:hypothetical protein